MHLPSQATSYRMRGRGVCGTPNKRTNGRTAAIFSSPQLGRDPVVVVVVVVSHAISRVTWGKPEVNGGKKRTGLYQRQYRYVCVDETHASNKGR
jgi:hypothetical protein